MIAQRFFKQDTRQKILSFDNAIMRTYIIREQDEKKIRQNICFCMQKIYFSEHKTDFKGCNSTGL